VIAEASQVLLQSFLSFSNWMGFAKIDNHISDLGQGAIHANLFAHNVAVMQVTVLVPHPLKLFHAGNDRQDEPCHFAPC